MEGFFRAYLRLRGRYRNMIIEQRRGGPILNFRKINCNMIEARRRRRTMDPKLTIYS